MPEKASSLLSRCGAVDGNWSVAFSTLRSLARSASCSLGEVGTMYTAADILKSLDRSAREFHFPGFNNMNYHLGAARLGAFRDAERWALVFEELVWWPSADGIP